MDVAERETGEEAALWQEWRASGDAALRERLLLLHLPFARTIAAMAYARRFHDEIEFGDYLQLATVGMLESLDRFDPARGVLFRTFAARRMQGAILNGLERLTEKQQQIAARQRVRNERLQDVKAMALQQAAGGAAPQGAQQLMKFVAEAGIGLALCWMLEGSGMLQEPERSETLPFYRSVAIRQLRERLLQAVESLPPQERTVIRNHYLQQLPFEEIAGMLQLTKGRISQIHKQALLRLRGLVRDQADWETVF
jgi:RNA polymerase sigma factor for flagellar operon FliA